VHVEVAHATRDLARPVALDAHDVRLGPNLAPTATQRVAQRCDRIALGLDGAAEVRTETAVVARGTPVVLDAVRAGGRPVRMQPSPDRGLAGHDRAEHVRARR